MKDKGLRFEDDDLEMHLTPACEFLRVAIPEKVYYLSITEEEALLDYLTARREVRRDVASSVGIDPTREPVSTPKPPEPSTIRIKLELDTDEAELKLADLMDKATSLGEWLTKYRHLGELTNLGQASAEIDQGELADRDFIGQLADREPFRKMVASAESCANYGAPGCDCLVCRKDGFR